MNLIWRTNKAVVDHKNLEVLILPDVDPTRLSLESFERFTQQLQDICKWGFEKWENGFPMNCQGKILDKVLLLAFHFLSDMKNIFLWKIVSWD